ncbi:MAG: hypothetical protein GF309_16300 [Candidatus Lokiarchaeota archaeon]|nr:hypothetical protein [Candidatus Lokiarchaeota archaeon]
MTDEQIIDYRRQRIVNRVFAVAVVVIVAIALYYYFTEGDTGRTTLLVYFGFPFALLVLSLILGAASKRAIDYIPGEWKETEKWVNFREYETMREEFEEAYGDLLGHGNQCCGCGFLIFLTIFLGSLGLIHASYAQPIFDLTLQFILLLVIIYGIIGISGFVLGFRIPTIDAENFFEAPTTDDTYHYTKALRDASMLRVGMKVRLGRRGDALTIMEAEPVANLEGLPDTVKVKVQVSSSGGFSYPYLVGTIYKGNPVSEGTKELDIRTRYKAIVEQSMDENVTVMVARFDIPKRTSSVPHISDSDFRKLGEGLARELEQNYEAAKGD